MEAMYDRLEGRVVHWGWSVSVCTVAQDLGHQSGDMVRRVYPGLGKVRPRVEAPEFHPEHGFDLADGRLVAKQAAAGATIRGVHR
jgi:hypothetical protein